MRKIKPPYINYMYLPTSLQELAHIISFLLYNTLKNMCVSGYPTVPNFLLTPPPSLLKNFLVRQYPTASQSAKAACDTGGTSMLVLFIEHSLDPSLKSTCMEPHMMLVLMTDVISEGSGEHVCSHNLSRVSLLTNKEDSIAK